MSASASHPPKAVTLNDVARAAGVSHQTVSRVINEHPSVAPATRARVLAAIRELGYRPNALARKLVTGRSKTVGIVGFGTTFYGPAQMVLSVERALKGRGYGFALASVDDLERPSLEGAVRELGRHDVEGLILITPLREVSLAEIDALCGGRPFVMIDVAKGSPLPSVVIDQGHGSALATRHLVDLGHHHVAEISGPLAWHDAWARHEAWRETLLKAGLTPGRSVEGDWTAEGGYRAAEALLSSGERFTALVVGNDQMALGALAALSERGVRVPEEVSVVGFDDVPEARFYRPP